MPRCVRTLSSGSDNQSVTWHVVPTVGIVISSAVLTGCRWHAEQGVGRSAAPSPIAPSATATPQARLRCTPTIWTGHGPEQGARSYLNTVAIRSSAPRTGSFDADQAPHRLMAKVALDVHARHPATLALAAPWIHHVAFRWGTDAQLTPWTTTLVLPSCPRSDGHAWMAFPGGFAYDHAAFVSIRLTVRNTSVTIPESVGGAPCPSGPSDH
jgi:hypothetical protein